MYILKIITFVLVIIGALNWGLVGAFSRIVYILVGISAVIFAILEYKHLIDDKSNKTDLY